MHTNVHKLRFVLVVAVVVAAAAAVVVVAAAAICVRVLVIEVDIIKHDITLGK